MALKSQDGRKNAPVFWTHEKEIELVLNQHMPAKKLTIPLPKFSAFGGEHACSN